LYAGGTPDTLGGMRDAPSLVVLGCWIVFIVTWAVAALFVKRTVERSRSWGRPVIVLMVTLSFWVGRRPHIVGTLRLWTPTLSTEWLAAVVVLLGLAVTLWARAALGSNWSGSVTFKQDHELIERGPYRFVRHPIYSGLLLMALGTAMLRAWISEFVFCAVLLLAFWLKLRAEERLLTRHFPEAYARYRARVRALIPFVL
jgi:protein-S-isoprenylcysteine O-methyltransferase Ste14